MFSGLHLINDPQGLCWRVCPNGCGSMVEWTPHVCVVSVSMLKRKNSVLVQYVLIDRVGVVMLCEWTWSSCVSGRGPIV